MTSLFDDLDVRRLCPPDLVEIINRPHEHEGLYHNRPIWLIWTQQTFRDGTVDVPRIDTVCDSADSAIAHIGMVCESYHGTVKVFVERIPLNHRFGSSLTEAGYIDAFLNQPSAVKLSAYPKTGARLYRRVGD